MIFRDYTTLREKTYKVGIAHRVSNRRNYRNELERVVSKFYEEMKPEPVAVAECDPAG